MSLVDIFPPASSGGGGSFDPTASIAFSGALDSFAGQTQLNGEVTWGTQDFTLNGGAQTIAGLATSGSLVFVAGSTAASTINLPSAVTVGKGTWFILANKASVVWTLGATAGTIDGGATQTMQTLSPVIVVSDGANWVSASLATWKGIVLFGQLAAANTWTTTNVFSGTVNLNGIANIKEPCFTRQAFAGSGSPTNTAGNIWALTGTSGGTFTAPATPATGLFIIVKDEGGNAAVSNLTFDSNGKNIDGASTKVINTAYGSFRAYYSGSTWFSF